MTYQQQRHVTLDRVRERRERRAAFLRRASERRYWDRRHEIYLARPRPPLVGVLEMTMRTAIFWIIRHIGHAIRVAGRWIEYRGEAIVEKAFAIKERSNDPD